MWSTRACSPTLVLLVRVECTHHTTCMRRWSHERDVVMPSQVPAVDRRWLWLRRRERGVGRIEREPLDHGAGLGSDPGVVVPVP